MKFRSIRARITALFALFVALLMLLTGGAVQRHERHRAEVRVREILSVARELAKGEIDRNAGTRSLLEIVRADAGEIAAGGLTLIVTQNNTILWQSRRRAPNWPAVGEDWRVRTLNYRGQSLVLASDWHPIREELAATALALWALGAIVVSATAVAAWFVVGITLAPLDALGAQARAASTENGGDKLAIRLSSPSSDTEMLTLTQTLNGLLARLQREAQARGRFYAAASHELRTPIQVLQGQIDVAQSRPRSVGAHEEVLAQLQAETQRLATLVADLLQLNSLEMRQSETPRETLNLTFWIERALAQQTKAINARRLQLKINLQEVEISAPSIHLEMLLRNLVENAVKYAEPNSTLEIRTQCTPRVRLHLWNACELPDELHIEDWFEPFYRPDAARNSQTGGNGLGLSIVAALGRANEWQIELHQRDGGVEVSVDFGKSQL